MIVAPRSVALPLEFSREWIGRARLCRAAVSVRVIGGHGPPLSEMRDNRETRGGDFQIAVLFYLGDWEDAALSKAIDFHAVDGWMELLNREGRLPSRPVLQHQTQA